MLHKRRFRNKMQQLIFGRKLADRLLRSYLAGNGNDERKLSLFYCKYAVRTLII